ncbi:MAG: amino acid adenylation domain-containing protein, partial [Chromatiales bacterium]|nr:amino acid adenylation domain-containing protein [Chromatiales bacterium]
MNTAPEPGIVDEFPLSFAQQRLWFLEQLEDTGAAYHVRLPLRLTGPLDVGRLQQALDALAARHEILRTSIVVRDGQPAQRIAPTVRVPLEQLDAESAASSIRELAGKLVARPFDLGRAPLLRASLVREGPESHVLLLVMHHVIADAWSSGVLFRDLAALYEGRDLPALELQYADYALWQREWLAGPALDAQLDWWRRHLDGAPELITLPLDRPRPVRQTFRGSRIARALPPQLATRLRGLAARAQVSQFMLLLAAFKVLLMRFGAGTDIVVGTPVAGRRRTELEQQVGLYANTLALRTDLSGEPDFMALLGRVRSTVLQAFDHQDLPFEKLVEALRPVRSLAHSPVFQVMFIQQNTPWEAAPMRELRVEPAELAPTGSTKFDLTVSASEYLGEYWLAFEYNTDLFEATTIDRLAATFEQLLALLAERPDKPVSRLPLLPAAERQRLLHDWNATAREPGAGDHLLAQFERRLAQAPAAIAVECAGERWSCEAVDQRARALASALHAAGTHPGDVVGVLLARGPAMVSTLLAIAHCRAAWLPLDPELPPARLHWMIEDSGARILVSDCALDDPLVPAGITVIGPQAGEAGTQASAGPVNPRDPAYLIYTSGSTGRPKGVRVAHGALANFLAAMRERPGFAAGERLLAVTTLSFDIALLELLLPMVAGGTAVIAVRDDIRDPRRLAALIDTAAIDVLQATPSAWRALLASGWQGRASLRMFCGGEALAPDLAAVLLPSGAALWNLYGPTETTIWSTVSRVTDARRPVTVGRPIANTRCYVLDAHGGLVPVGVVGELWIGGSGVALGYAGREDLTAERFVADPYAEEPGARMYRTGDRARWRSDGELELLGRVDDQVKLR